MHGGVTVIGDENVKITMFEIIADDGNDRFIVVHDQNRLRHNGLSAGRFL
jgi:hypothetical protein